MEMSVKKIHHQLDLRGKVCPDSTLEPCLTVDRMAVGEVLEVITDFYPARQTIPKLIEERGHLCDLVDGETGFSNPDPETLKIREEGAIDTIRR